MSSRLVSNSTTEIVKIQNRLADTESKARLDLNQNIDTFRGICFVADKYALFEKAFKDFFTIGGKLDEKKLKTKIKQFTAKEAFLNSRNDPELVPDGDKGKYYQVFVYLVDEDPKSWDPRVNEDGEEIEKGSEEYWGKVKNLHKALIPKKINGQKQTPSNESEWKFKFLKGGPNRGEWLSGVAILREPDETDPDPIPDSSSGGGSGGSGGSGGGSGNRHNTKKIQKPDFVDQPPQRGIYFWVCNNGRLEWVEGSKVNADGTYDKDVQIIHDRNLIEFYELKVGTEYQSVEPKGSAYVSFEALKGIEWLDFEGYQASVLSEESNSYNDYNKYGYVGAYQMGYDALIDHGFIPLVKGGENYNRIKNTSEWQTKEENKKTGKQESIPYSQRITEEMFMAANWDPNDSQQVARWGKETIEYFKEQQDIYFKSTTSESAKTAIRKDVIGAYRDSQTIQDNAFATYTASRLQSLIDNNLADLSDPQEIHGFLMGAHLKGLGAIDKNDINYEGQTEGGIYGLVVNGETSSDRNNTPIEYYVQQARYGYLNRNGNPCEDSSSGGDPE